MLTKIEFFFGSTQIVHSKSNEIQQIFSLKILTFKCEINRSHFNFYFKVCAIFIWDAPHFTAGGSTIFQDAADFIHPAVAVAVRVSAL